MCVWHVCVSAADKGEGRANASTWAGGRRQRERGKQLFKATKVRTQCSAHKAADWAALPQSETAREPLALSFELTCLLSPLRAAAVTCCVCVRVGGCSHKAVCVCSAQSRLQYVARLKLEPGDCCFSRALCQQQQQQQQQCAEQQLLLLRAS